MSLAAPASLVQFVASPAWSAVRPLCLGAAALVATACGAGSEAPLPAPDDDHDGYTTDDGDCNDEVAAVNPGMEEVCADRNDTNCDGTPGDCHPRGGEVESAKAYALGDYEDDEFGDIVSACGDLDGDGDAEFVVGMPNFGQYVSTGAVYVFTGRAGSGQVAPALRLSSEQQGFGNQVACESDLDGDGANDLAVRGDSGLYVMSGAELLGLSDGWGSEVAMLEDSSRASVYDVYGGTPDVDGDGTDDLLVTGTFDGASQAAVLLGEAGEAAPRVSWSHVVDWTHALGRLVDLLPASDLDGDGLGDVVFALEDGVVVVHGDAELAPDLSDAEAVSEAWAPCAGTDLDGDGRGDLATFVAASVYVLSGTDLQSGTVEDVATSELYYPDGERLLACPGDIDDDGRGEVLLLVEPAHDSRASEVVVLFGGADESLLPAASAYWSSENQVTSAFGIGDFDGDGTGDLALGESEYGTGDDYEERGALWLFQGVGW